MSTEAITEKPEREGAAGSWQPALETAPSVLRQDEPTVARIIALVGLLFVAVGGVALISSAAGWSSRISPGLGSFFLVIGLAGMLYHAARDADLQVRRAYGTLGAAWIITAIVVTSLPIKGQPGSQFLPWGFFCLTLGLLFLLPFIRNETEAMWRQRALYGLGVVGVVLAATGFIGANVMGDFLLPHGLLLILLGLAYLWGFVGLLGISDDLSYRVALGIGVAGLAVFVVALGRTLLPPLFHYFHWIGSRPDPYLVPTGLVLMGLGLLYVVACAGIASESQLASMTRRELAAFFYSPIAYIALFSLTLLSWLMFFQFFINFLLPSNPMEATAKLPEPIVFFYFINIWPIICVIFLVPVLTMRLLSEENRSGTMEVLLTAPVSETHIVVSKFLAAFIFFMLAWLPYGLYLVSLRVEAGQAFEYRPLLSCYIALACSGAGFVGMGLFFSSLTRNQIVAAVITGVGMVFWTLMFFVKRMVEGQWPNSVGASILAHVSYIDLWWASAEGVLSLRLLVFHVSAAIFWLFLTVKVLESRKWR